MRSSAWLIGVLTLVQGSPCLAQASAPAGPADPIAVLVGRLDLERYKATIKGLTQFGDRRQGTKRNRDAVDWIEAQLKSYGCPTERIVYQFNPAPRPANPGAGRGGAGRGGAPSNIAQGGGRYRGVRARTGVNT